MIDKLKLWFALMFKHEPVKPKIKICVAGGYICHGFLAHGFGSTPVKAYEDWQRNIVKVVGSGFYD